MNHANVKNDRPKIYVLVGAPCSGKSTWTDKFLASLKEDENYVIISSDNIIEELSENAGLNYSQGWEKFIGQATARMKSEYAAAVKARKNIIYDQTNMGSKKRASLIDHLVGYEKTAVVFDCDTKTLFERNRKRSETSGKFVPEHIILNMLKSYQPPTKKEFDNILRIQT